MRMGQGEGIGVSEDPYRPRVTIQEGAPDVRPLFCIPGAGASITSFCDLAQALGPRFSLHGMEPRGQDGAYEPYRDVHSAAHAYIQAIFEFAPAGPYQLLGYSFGGWVAFETARQLRARGCEVSALIIVDSEPPSSDGCSGKHYTRIDALLKLIRLFELRLGRSISITAFDLARLNEQQQVELLLRRLIELRVFSDKTDAQMLSNVVKVFETSINTTYFPSGPYSGPLHLLTAAESLDGDEPGDEDVLALWRRHAPNATLTECPGNHVTMLMPPHVKSLARELRNVLKQ